MRMFTAMGGLRRRQVRSTHDRTKDIGGRLWYRPGLEALEDRTLPSGYFADLASQIQDFAGPHGTIQTVLDTAHALPFIGKQLGTLDQITDPLRQIATQVAKLTGGGKQTVPGVGSLMVTVNADTGTFGISGAWDTGMISVPAGKFDLGLGSFLHVIGGTNTFGLDANMSFNLNFKFSDDSSGLQLDAQQGQRPLALGLSVYLSDPNNPGQPFTLDATLAGLLEATVTDEITDAKGNYYSGGGSNLKGTVGLVMEPDANGNLALQPFFTGNVDANLHLKLGLDPKFQATLNPQLGADLHVTWGFDTSKSSPNGVSFASSASTSGEGQLGISFDKVYLDLGASMPTFFQPIINSIQQFTKPIQPVLDFLNSPLPIVSDFGVHETFLQLLSPSLPSGFSNALQAINIINNLSASGAGIIPLGSFTVDQGNGGIGSILDNIGGTLANQVSNIVSQLPFPVVDAAKDILDEVSTDLSNSGATADFSSFISGTTGGVSFPLFEHPEKSVFQMLLGQDVDLFKFTLVPPFSYPLSAHLYFGIPGVLGMFLNGNLTLTINLSLGYDTHGLRKVISDLVSSSPPSAGQIAQDIADGFYFNNAVVDASTTPPTHATGIYLSGKLTAGGEVTVVQGSGTIQANLAVNFSPDVTGSDHYHYARLDTIITAIANGDSPFEASGQVTASADLSVGALGLKLYDYQLANETLYTFDTFKGPSGNGQNSIPNEIVLNLGTGDQSILVGSYTRVDTYDYQGHDNTLLLENGIKVTYEGAGGKVEYYPTSYEQYPVVSLGVDGWTVDWKDGTPVNSDQFPAPANPYFFVTKFPVDDNGKPNVAIGNQRIIIDSTSPVFVPHNGETSAAAAFFNNLSFDSLASINSTPWAGVGALLVGGDGNDDFEFHDPQGRATLIGGGGSNTLVGGVREYGYLPDAADQTTIISALSDPAIQANLSAAFAAMSNAPAGYDKLTAPDDQLSELYAGPAGSYLQAGRGAPYELFGGPGNDWFEVPAYEFNNLGVETTVDVTGGGGTDTLHILDDNNGTVLDQSDQSASTVSNTLGITPQPGGGEVFSVNSTVSHTDAATGNVTDSTYEKVSVTASGVQALLVDFTGPGSIDAKVNLPDPSTIPQLVAATVHFRAADTNSLTINGINVGHNDFTVGPDKGGDVVINDQYGLNFVANTFRVWAKGLKEGDVLDLVTADENLPLLGSTPIDPQDTVKVTVDANNFFSTVVTDYSAWPVQSLTVDATPLSPAIPNSAAINVDDNMVTYSADTYGKNGLPVTDSGNIEYYNDVALLTVDGPSFGPLLHQGSDITLGRPAARGDTTLVGGNADNTFVINNSLGHIEVDGGDTTNTFTTNGTGNYVLYGGGYKNQYNINLPTINDTIGSTTPAQTTIYGTGLNDFVTVNGEPTNSSFVTDYQVAPGSTREQYKSTTFVTGHPPATVTSAIVIYQKVRGVTLNTDSQGIEFGCTVDVNGTDVPATINTGPGLNYVNITPQGETLDALQKSVTVNGGTGGRTSLAIYDQNNGYLSADSGNYSISAFTVQRGHIPLIFYTNIDDLTLYEADAHNFIAINSKRHIHEHNATTISQIDIPTPSVDGALLTTVVDTSNNQVTDNVTLNDLAHPVELQGNRSDARIHLGGAVRISAATLAAAAPNVGDTFTLIDNDSAALWDGSYFSNGGENAVFQLNGLRYHLNYQVTPTDSANPDVVLTYDNTPPSNIHTDISSSILGEGIAVSGHILFTDPDLLDTHTVTIDWGDHTTPDVLDLAAGVTEASISHTYAEEGSYAVNVTVDDHHKADSTLGIGPGSVAAKVITFLVADAPLVLANTPPVLTEVTNTNVVLASFSDAGSDGTARDYTVSVAWGDGTVSQTGDGTSTVTVVPVGPNTFQVVGSHTYAAEEGAVYIPTITIADVGGAKAYGPLSWQPGPATLVSREGAVAVRSTDGKIYVAGGSDGTHALADFEVFDPTNHARTETPWTSLANLPVPLVGLAAAAGADGDIYVFGGTSSGPLSSASAYRYNPAKNTWTRLASMPQATSYAAAVTGPDGLIYVFGGEIRVGSVAHPTLQILNTVQVYNPATNAWSTRQPMPTARSHLAVVLSDGNIYVLGGQNSSGPLTTVEIFNPRMPSSHGKVLTWLPFAPSMAQARASFAAVVGPQGFIYALGGDAGNSVEVLDPTTAVWFTANGLNLSQSAFAAAASADGRIFVVDGVVNGSVSNSVQILQPTPVTLADAPLVEGGERIEPGVATETVPFTFLLASFLDNGNDGTTNDYTGTIQWTATTSTPASFRLNANGSISILGSFTYPLAGSYPITISVQDHGASLTLHKTVLVKSLLTDATSAGTTLNATEGTNLSDAVLATFTYPDPNVSAGDFNASIDWKDGQGQPDVSAGTVQKISQNGTQSTFQIIGSHTYAEAGLYTPQTTVSTVPPLPGSPITSQLISIQVADVPLTDITPATTIAATAGLDTGPEVVAIFVDPNLSALSTDYAALIDWGDGTAGNPDITTGTIQYHSIPGTEGYDFQVLGNHAYLRAGTYAVRVTVSDGGSPNVFSGDTSFQVGAGSVKVTFQTDSQHSFDVAAQSYSWGGAEPFVNGSSTGKAVVTDFHLTFNPSTVDPGLWRDMVSNTPFAQVTVHVLDAAGNAYVAYTLDNAGVSSFHTTESGGAVPVDQVTLAFTSLAEDYRIVNPDGTTTDNTAQFHMGNGGGGGSLVPPAPASLPRVGITFDTGTTSAPLPELAVESYFWSGSEPFAAGNSTGSASVQDLQVTLDPSVEPGLWGALVSNLSIAHATLHVRDAAGREYLTYTLDNVYISSFQTGANGGAAPVDQVTLAFQKLTENYQTLNSDGSAAFDNQAQFDQSPEGQRGGGSLTPPAPTAPPQVGITFDTAAGPGTELAVQSFSWGGSEPFANGSPTGAASVQDLQVTLYPSSVEPGLWGAMVSNLAIPHATLDVRDAAGRVYLTYTLDNVMLSSFQISEGGGTAPVDQVTLTFQKLTEDYQVLNSDGSTAFDNQAQFDRSLGGNRGGGSLTPPAPASPPQVAIAFDTAAGPGTELAVQSFSWGGSEPFANGSPTGAASVQDLQVTLDPSSVEPGLWGAMVSNVLIPHATLDVRDAAGRVYLIYTLDNVMLSSFQISESGGTAPVDVVTLTFQKLSEDYQVLNSDGSTAFDNQAKFDRSFGGQRGGGSLAPPALASPPQVGITFDTSRGPGTELAVQSYLWTGSNAAVGDLEVTLAPSSVEPALWGTMVSNLTILDATLRVRDAAGNNYLTYTLDNAMISSFQITESGGMAPVDVVTLAFQHITETSQVAALDGSTISNQAQFDVTNGGSSDPLSPPTISPPKVGITFVTGSGAQTAEMAVQSYSWGGSEPFLNGVSTGQFSLQDFQLTLNPTSVEPELWGALVTNAEFAHATIHVRDASGNEYLNYTLDNVHFSSFQTNESGGAAPVDRVTLAFTNITQGPAQTTTTLTSVAYPAGIVSAYQGDGNANDAIGTNNGTIQGNVTFEPGKFGQAFHFDGATGEGVSIPASSSLDVGSGNGLTLTAWINPDDVSSQEPIIEWTNGLHLWFSVTNGGAVGPGDLYANMTSGIIYSAPGIVQAHEWQFVVLTYDKTSGSTTLYLNGQVVAQKNMGSFSPYTASDVNLGHRLPNSFSGSGQFAGGMDEVGIYNRALTTSEISALYSGSGNPSAPGQPVVFTATVSANSGTPTGAVAFSVDGGASQSVALTNGEAQLTATNLSAGSHTIAAVYTPADSSFQGSQTSFTQTVQTQTITWINSAGGDWDTASNWSGGVVPGPNDDVVINVSPAVTITHAQNVTDAVRSVTASDPILFSAGTLDVAGSFSDSSGVRLSGGTLGKATVAAGTTINVTGGATIDGVTLDGDLVINSYAAITAVNGLTLNGTVHLNSTYFDFPASLILSGTGPQTLAGTGQVVFAGGNPTGSDNQLYSQGGSLTLAAGITVVTSTGGGTVGIGGGQSQPLTVLGTISSAPGGQGMTVTGSTVTVSNGGSLQVDDDNLTVTNLQNASGGTVSASAGATLTLTGTLSNNGAITETNATVNLQASFTLAQLGTFQRSGGTVNLQGTLDDTGTTLALDDTTGSWNLAGGTIKNGSVTTAGQAQLVATASSTLDGVTLAGDLEINSYVAVTAVNGLTLNNGTVHLNSSYFDFPASLILSGTGAQTLAGTGAVVFAGGSSTGSDNQLFSTGGSLTLAAGISVVTSTGGGQVGSGSQPLIIQGTISSTSGGQGMTVTGSTVSNTGSLQAAGGSLTVTNLQNASGGTVSASAGSTLTLTGTLSNNGTITETNATVNLQASFTLAQLGAFQRSGGTVNLQGTLDDTGTTLALDNTTGSWNLAGGTIKNGSVTTAGQAQLVATASSTLDGVTLAGDLEINSSITVTAVDGLSLNNGTVDLNSTYFDSTTSLILSGTGPQTLAGTGEVVFAGGNPTGSDNRLSSAGGSLTLAAGISVVTSTGGGMVGSGSQPLIVLGIVSSVSGGQGMTVAGSSITNAGTVQANGGTLVVVGPLTSTGTLQALAGGSLTLQNATAVNQSGILAGPSGASITVDGNLVGSTTNAAGYGPQATVTLAGSGTAASPQLLEAMSDDVGAVASGFTGNFAYAQLALANNTYVQLVDNAHNSTGTGAEAVYAATLIVPAGTTLDLNGLHFYARSVQINGTVVNGSVTLVP